MLISHVYNLAPLPLLARSAFCMKVKTEKGNITAFQMESPSCSFNLVKVGNLRLPPTLTQSHYLSSM